jgi:hypothetical protein
MFHSLFSEHCKDLALLAGKSTIFINLSTHRGLPNITQVSISATCPLWRPRIFHTQTRPERESMRGFQTPMRSRLARLSYWKGSRLAGEQKRMNFRFFGCDERKDGISDNGASNQGSVEVPVSYYVAEQAVQLLK